MIFENFAIDFNFVVNQNDSTKLEPYVQKAVNDYPRSNEDNTIVIALCMNPNLSIDQMKRLGVKYGKYVKSNSSFDINMLSGSVQDIKSLSNISTKCKLDDYESIVVCSSTGVNFSLHYSSDPDSFKYDLIEDSNDPEFLKKIFYLNEIKHATYHKNVYLAGKMLRVIDPDLFNIISVRAKWSRSVIKSFVQNEITESDLKKDNDLNSIFPIDVFEVFNSNIVELKTEAYFQEYAMKYIELICLISANNDYTSIGGLHYIKKIIYNVLAVNGSMSVYIPEHIRGAFGGKLYDFMNNISG